MVEESLNVVFDESKPHSKYKDLVEEDNDPKVDCQDNVENTIRQIDAFDNGTISPNNPLEVVEVDNGLPPDIPWGKSHPIENIMGDLTREVQTRSQYCKEIVKKFEMENVKPLSTPMSPSEKLIADETGKSVENKKYRAIDAPGGFLFEWWSVFWDIFIARTNEKHSEAVASYIEGHLNENFSALENFGQSNNMEFYAEEALNLFFERTGNVLTEMKQELSDWLSSAFPPNRSCDLFSEGSLNPYAADPYAFD
ncbi:hypothetical protein AgCh_034713 [Apium graveolens]